MPTRTRSLDIETLTRIAQILKCIAHPVRLSVVEILDQEERLTVGELREKTGLEQSLLSHHLIKMKDKGVLVSERKGKHIIYSLKDRHIVRIFDCMEKCKLL